MTTRAGANLPGLPFLVIELVSRVLFLGALALWGAACAFLATVLRNFASYSAALAG